MSMSFNQEHFPFIPFFLNKYEKNYPENSQEIKIYSEFQNNLNFLQANYVQSQVLAREREKVQMQLQTFKTFIWSNIANVKNYEEKAIMMNLIQKLNLLEQDTYGNIIDWNVYKQNFEMKYLQLLSSFQIKSSTDFICSRNNYITNNSLTLPDNKPDVAYYPYLEKFNSISPINSDKENLSKLNNELLKPLEKANLVNSNSTQTSNSGSEDELTVKTNLKQTRKANFLSNKRQNVKSEDLKNPLLQKQFELACQIYPKKSIGNKTWEERIKLILKFKLKKIERSQKRKISKKFIGRSKEATKKLRFKGRFVKDLNKKRNVFKIKRN